MEPLYYEENVTSDLCVLLSQSQEVKGADSLPYHCRATFMEKRKQLTLTVITMVKLECFWGCGRELEYSLNDYTTLL